MEKEIWKPVPDYEGLYEVSNYGRVKSLARKVPMKLYGGFRETSEVVMKPRYVNSGYLTVALCKSGKKTRITLHSLVANVFIENPNSHPQINHKDEDKSNNYYKNLEWVSVRGNKTYSINKRITSSNLVGAYLKRARKSRVWGSCICINGNSIHLGYFHTEEEAHQAYLDALRKYGLKNKYAIKKPPK